MRAPAPTDKSKEKHADKNAGTHLDDKMKKKEASRIQRNVCTHLDGAPLVVHVIKGNQQGTCVAAGELRHLHS